MGTKNSVVDKHSDEVALVTNVWVFLNAVPEHENPEHFYSIRRIVISYRYESFDYYVNLQFGGNKSYLNIDSKGRHERRKCEDVHMQLIKSDNQNNDVLYNSMSNNITLPKKVNEILREYHVPILPDVLPLNGFRYKCLMFDSLNIFNLIEIKIEDVMNGKRGEPFQAPFDLDVHFDFDNMNREVEHSAEQIEFVQKEATKLLAKYLN